MDIARLLPEARKVKGITLIEKQIFSQTRAAVLFASNNEPNVVSYEVQLEIRDNETNAKIMDELMQLARVRKSENTYLVETIPVVRSLRSIDHTTFCLARGAYESIWVSIEGDDWPVIEQIFAEIFQRAKDHFQSY